MEFCSTRGGREGRRYGFEEAVRAGWAEDGGMLLPLTMPVVDRATLQSWGKLSYTELCAEILRRFVSVDEISSAELTSVIQTSFSCFADDEVNPCR